MICEEKVCSDHVCERSDCDEAGTGLHITNVRAPQQGIAARYLDGKREAVCILITQPLLAVPYKVRCILNNAFLSLK